MLIKYSVVVLAILTSLLLLIAALVIYSRSGESR
jgi:hypothetical protein